MPYISIIIPFIDEYHFLREAVQSVHAQELSDIELIIVRNHPDPPDTSQIPASSLSVKWLHAPESGSAHARNAGLHAASGYWIQFLDVDDILFDSKIRQQSAQQHADVVVSPHIFQFVTGKKVRSKWLPEDHWVGLLNSGLGSTSSMLWKRDTVLEAGGWNTDLQSHQEYELLFRFMSSGRKLHALERYDTLVRQRLSGSITQTSRSVRNQEGIQVREKMWGYLVTNAMVTPEREDAFLQYVFRQLRGIYRANAAAAVEKYTSIFKGKKFRPKGLHLPGYSVLYAIFGFALTERIMLFFRRFRGGRRRKSS
jgi:glycosyltransferase involved in cell wall biosynthesis